MKILVLVSLFFLPFAQPTNAQTVDPCATVAPGTTFVVMSNGLPKIMWIMDTQVPINPPTDMTLVPQRIEGFFIQVSAQTRIDTGKLIPTTCPAGTANAGKWAFTFTLPTNLTKGIYTLSVNGYNFILNSDGTPTTTRQEGIVTSIPFSVVDPSQIGPPLAPKNVLIIK